MKVFCAALGHETNSFSPIPTNRESFASTILLRPGDDRMNRPMYLLGVDTIVAAAKDEGYEMALSTIAFAQPSAPTVRSDYESLRDEILDDLRREDPVDQVFLLLHGAMMAEGYDDCEGDIIARARDIVGPDVPIGVLLDLHCNVTNLMFENATIIMACREYPHVDFDERAGELFDQINAAALGKTKPITRQFRVPMLAMFHTPREPMRGFVDAARDCERHNNVLQVTLAHGFPWSDFEGAGASVLVTTDDDEEKPPSSPKNLAASSSLCATRALNLCSRLRPLLTQSRPPPKAPSFFPTVRTMPAAAQRAIRPSSLKPVSNEG